MELAYERRGSGDPLVLIHGLGGTKRIWSPVIGLLAAQRDVIAVDLPGFGDSPELSDGIAASAANLGAAVSELCTGLGIERPHLAGNSLGAWAALEIAKQGRAASVCAISPAGLWRAPLGPRRHDLRRWARRLRPALYGVLGSARARAAFLGGTVAHPELLSPREARGLVADWLDAPGYDAANAQMRSHVYEPPDGPTVPTTIAWGSKDRLVAPPRRERMPPGSRYLVLEGLGHTPTWDDPERVAALLLESSSEAAVPSGEALAQP